MGTEHIDTIVVGAGPAGSTCGYILQKSGRECLVIDRKEFPRDKLCGGGLTPKAHLLIDKIFDGIQYDYYPVGKINIHNWSGKFAFSLDLDVEIRTVLRDEFDAALLSEYQKIGGRFLTETLSGIEERDNKIFLRFRSGKQLSCNYLVGADGANSVVRKYIQPGFDKGIICFEQHVNDRSVKDIDIYFERRFKRGYLYAFPNKKGYVIGYGNKNSNIKEFKKALNKLKLGDESKIKGAYIPMFDEIAYPFRKDILLTGDAGGYADPLTGEGIFFAVQSGENAALSIIDGSDFKSLNQPLIDTILRRKKISSTLTRYPLLFSVGLRLCKNSHFFNNINKRFNRALLPPFYSAVTSNTTLSYSSLI